ncbi:helix-turn-helix domain-containing protein [Paraclostridium sordellii]|uniref:helix-turn-helix domain-containing protein n=1 Tax=Paraclostridium sordellii TaxID=1505 RepID=UPI00097CA7E9|nr:helix-turn-helix domain-containing protein [Paeniclostridium sordellii]
MKGVLHLFKKLKNNNYNWTFHYIKEYNQMVSFYEKQISDKDIEIKKLNNELDKLKSNSKFKTKQKQISDEDIERIKQLKENGKSYSYISKETGWSKATISRVINNKKGIY